MKVKKIILLVITLILLIPIFLSLKDLSKSDKNALMSKTSFYYNETDYLSHVGKAILKVSDQYNEQSILHTSVLTYNNVFPDDWFLYINGKDAGEKYYEMMFEKIKEYDPEKPNVICISSLVIDEEILIKFAKALNELGKKVYKSGSNIKYKPLVLFLKSALPINLKKLPAYYYKIIMVNLDDEAKKSLYIGFAHNPRITPPLGYNHTKLFIKNGEFAVTGGVNLTNNIISETDNVHDLAMKLEGEAAKKAEWFYMFALWKNRTISVVSWDPFYEYPKEYEDYFQNSYDDNPFSGIEKKIAVFSLSRYWFTINNIPLYDISSDQAVYTALRSAKKSLKISQEMLLFQGGYVNEIFDIFAELLLLREEPVEIKIIISKSTECFEKLIKHIYKIGLKNNLTNKQIHDILQKYLKLAVYDYDEDPTPHHSHNKFYMIDDTAFYIGSQNLYPTSILNPTSIPSIEVDEHGFLVDTTAKNSYIVKPVIEWYDTVWKYSKKHMIGPDLIPEYIDISPDPVTTFKPITFNTIISNKGNFATKDFQITWSVDGIKKETQTIKGVEPDSFVDAYFSQIINNTGIHLIECFVDSDYEEIELDEENNKSTYTLIIKKADLTPTSINIENSANIIVGDEVQINTLIENIGGCTASQSVTKLSIGNIETGSYFEKDIITQSINPYKSINLIENWIPNEPGNYLIDIELNHNGAIDEETTENNFIQCSVYVNEAGLPDLVPIDVIIEDEDNINVWDNVIINIIVENTGNSPASNSITNVKIGNNYTANVRTPAIEPGASQTISCLWRPDAAGDFTITIEADRLDQIDEEYETNNIIEYPVHVNEVYKPDLIPIYLNFNFEEPEIDSEIEIIVEVGNYGTVPAPQSLTLIDIGSLEPGYYHAEEIIIPELDVNETYSFTYTWIPEITGYHVVAVKVNCNNEIDEMRNDNNIMMTQIDIYDFKKADLVTSNLHPLSQKPYFPDEEIVFNVNVENNGDLETGPYESRKMIQKENGSLILFEVVNSQSLDVGEKIIYPINWTPEEPGRYYVSYIADIYDDVREYDDTNNKSGMWILINDVDDLPDLMTDTITQIGNDPLTTGKNFTFKANVKNQGEIYVDSFNIKWTITDADDNIIYEYTGVHKDLDIGETGEYDNCFIEYNFNQGGQYKLTYQVDYDNQITELNEDNNQSTLTINVSESNLPDIKPGFIDLTSNYVVGEASLLETSISNISPAPCGQIICEWYINNDLYGTLNYDALDGNNTINGISLNWVPDHTGIYFITFKVTVPGGEINDANNTTSRSVYISTDINNSPKLLIIVNSTIYSQIQPQITQYRSDLTGYGFSNILHEWQGGTVEDLKALIEDYYYITNINGVLLIGDFPAAWYEIDNNWQQKNLNQESIYPGDNPDHEEFPCDIYLMDIDGTWEDTDNNQIYNSHPPNTDLEVFVARITGSAAEIINYFDKNHLYRSTSSNIPNSGFQFIDEDWQIYGTDNGFTEIYNSVIKNYTPDNTNKIDYINNLVFGSGYDFVHQKIHSAYDALHINGNELIYADDYLLSKVKAHFINLYNCSAGRFTVDGSYLAKSYIINTASTISVVASTKAGSMKDYKYFHTYLGNFNDSKYWGEAFRLWYNNYGFQYDNWNLGMVIIGDPMATINPSNFTPELNQLSDIKEEEKIDYTQYEDLYKKILDLNENNKLDTFEEYKKNNPQFFND